jgi:hypothetical protein
MLADLAITPVAWWLLHFHHVTLKEGLVSSQQLRISLWVLTPKPQGWNFRASWTPSATANINKSIYASGY